MFKKLKIIVIAIVIVILAAGAGYYIWSDITRKPALTPGVGDTTEPTTIVGSDNQQAEQIQQVEQLEHPNLDRPINVIVNSQPEIQKSAIGKIKKLSNELKKNSNNYDSWLFLGVYRKVIGDYEYAAECWQYAVYLVPSSFTPYNNLGNLYTYFLKDYKKAEENFKKAIANGPHEIYIYRSFYEFYHFVLKDDIKTKQLLEQGIKENPGAHDLKSLLDNL